MFDTILSYVKKILAWQGIQISNRTWNELLRLATDDRHAADEDSRTKERNGRTDRTAETLLLLLLGIDTDCIPILYSGILP
jgi:hypothetical protein